MEVCTRLGHSQSQGHSHHRFSSASATSCEARWSPGSVLSVRFDVQSQVVSLGSNDPCRCAALGSNCTMRFLQHRPHSLSLLSSLHCVRHSKWNSNHTTARCRNSATIICQREGTYGCCRLCIIRTISSTIPQRYFSSSRPSLSMRHRDIGLFLTPGEHHTAMMSKMMGFCPTQSYATANR